MMDLQTSNTHPAKVIRIGAIGLCILAAVWFVGCKSDKDFKPSKLVGPLYSGKSLEAVERDLDVKPRDLRIVEDRRPLNSDKRPPFRILTIGKAEFPLLGAAGKDLLLTFYNDRLMTVQFYPYNLDVFKASLASNDSVALSTVGDAFVAPSTRIWVGKDENGQTYVGFRDQALQGEYNEWIRKYEK